MSSLTFSSHLKIFGLFRLWEATFESIKHKTVKIFEDVNVCWTVNILCCTIIRTWILTEGCASYSLFCWNFNNIVAERSRLGCTLDPASLKERQVNNCGLYLIRDDRSWSSSPLSSIHSHCPRQPSVPAVLSSLINVSKLNHPGAVCFFSVLKMFCK